MPVNSIPTVCGLYDLVNTALWIYLCILQHCLI